LKWESVVTASTVTVESNRGYFINTTSNACTVTLPASPDVGDQVILLDYARTWDTNAITIDSNGNDFQNQSDDYIVDYDTEGQGINIVFSGSTNGWIPNSDIANALTPVAPTRAIFAFGTLADGSQTNLSNLVSSSGVVASDTTGVGTVIANRGAAAYGGDKAIFGFGTPNTGITNLVSNSGVVASDTAAVGTARRSLGATSFGGDKAIFAFGRISSRTGISNLVSNSGVVASDTSAVGTARDGCTGTGYGADKGIICFGYTSSSTAISNLISNSGVVASDTSAVSGVTARHGRPAAARYGGVDAGTAFFAYGTGPVNMKNLVNNSGVIAADVTGVGTAREDLAAATYGPGATTAICAFGNTGSVTSISNLVNSSGVVASDTTGVGTARGALSAAEFG
jgi:hypothetical protein